MTFMATLKQARRDRQQRDFVDEAGSRAPRVGAPYVGWRDGDRLAYAGKIQVGLTLDQAVELRTTLQQLV
jgi:bifunctional non-homologous end joining protein LigD